MAVTLLGTIGDVNLLDYDGGYVYQRNDGTVFIEYLETPCDDDPWFDENGYKSYELPLRYAPYTIYHVEVSDDIKADLSWIGEKGWKQLAQRGNGDSSKVEGEELARALSRSATPLERARLYWDVAIQYGWHELDHYPDHVTGEEAAERFGVPPAWGDHVCEVALWKDTALELKELCDLPEVAAWAKANEKSMTRIKEALREAMERANFTE